MIIKEANHIGKLGKESDSQSGNRRVKTLKENNFNNVYYLPMCFYNFPQTHNVMDFVLTQGLPANFGPISTLT